MSNTVIVTGGASGLGKALALRWAKAGWQIVIADINKDAGEAFSQVLNEQGTKTIFVYCDVTKVAQIQQLKERTLAEFGRVDCVINNAGVATADRVEDESLKQWQWVFDINLFAAIKVTQAFVSLFKQQGHGYFLNVSSQAGVTPIPFMSSYNASKAALVSFSETTRLELANFNVGVSVLCPGFFKTNLGNSLKTQLPVMKALLERVFEKAEISAEQVADKAFKSVQQNDFQILTHKEGIKAFLMKRLLPMKWYLSTVAKQTKNLRLKVEAEHK